MNLAANLAKKAEDDMKSAGSSGLRAGRMTGLACVALLALAACGGQAAPAASPAASTAPPPPPPAPSAMAAAPAPSASAAPSAAPAPAPVPGATGEVEDAAEHRHHHGGGVTMLIAMSLRDLQLTDDQKAKVEKARTDLMEKMKPVHAADKDFASVLADGVAAGKVDKAKTDASIDKLVAQSQKLHDASAEALVQLHDALTSAQRAELVEKMQGHFEKWKAAHGKDEADEKEHHSGQLLALVRELNLPQDEAQNQDGLPGEDEGRQGQERQGGGRSRAQGRDRPPPGVRDGVQGRQVRREEGELGEGRRPHGPLRRSTPRGLPRGRRPNPHRRPAHQARGHHPQAPRRDSEALR